MTQHYNTLGQSAPVADEVDVLYMVQAAKCAVCSTLSICNRSGDATTFRVSVRPNSEQLDNKHYLAYDSPIRGNDSLFLTIGLSLGPLSVVEVSSDSGTVSFGLFGAILN